MKVRKFYPRQVLRRLSGEHTALKPGQAAAVRYAALKGRKLGISIMAISTATAADMAMACNSKQAEAILANANTRIILQEKALVRGGRVQ